MLKYNKLSKKPDSKTGFIVTEGEPLFTQTLYLLQPGYVHSRSPVFSLVSQKGKHITSLYQACNGALIGDYQKKGLIAFSRGEGLAFDIFLSDQSPIELKAKLCTGMLNDELSQARKEAA